MKCLRVLGVVFATVALFAMPASAGGRVVISGLRMDPSDVDARNFSRPGWGGGAELVAPLPVPGRLLAGVFGVDVVNLLSQTVKFQDPLTSLRVEQQTEQHYARVFLGAQFGSHSRGFLRPYVGANVAAVFYGMSTTVVVPDSYDRQNDIRQTLRDRNQVAFGWDANAGLDLNFRDHLSVDMGVRALHAYGVPQQLGADAVKIQPGYVEYKLGIGIPIHMPARR
jgi:opacity protein-like surface antigen